MMNNGLSTADAVLLTDRDRGSNNNGWGGEGGWLWIFFLFFLLAWGNGNWGGFGGGNGMNAVQPALTRGELCQDFNFQDLQSGVRNIGDGLSRLGYELCNQFATVNSNINLGFSNLNSTICNAAYENAGLFANLGNTVQQGFNATNVALLQGQNALSTQVAQCCCGLEKGQMQTQYEMAQNTCALQNTIQTGFRDSIEATNAGTRAILDYLCQDKISTLQSENQSLKNSISQANQNTLLTNAMSAQTAQLIQRIAPYPIPAYVVTQPTASYYNGYGFGCGCNTGCGCGCGSVA